MDRWHTALATLLLALPAALTGCIAAADLPASAQEHALPAPPECDCPCASSDDTAYSCAIPEQSPAAAFELLRVLDGCDECASAEAVVAPGGAWRVATERGLLVPGDNDTRVIPAPLPTVATPIAPPTIASTASGGAWWSRLVVVGAVPALVMARWEEGDVWASTRLVTPVDVPGLAAAERAWVVETDWEIVLVVASDVAVWAARSFDGGETFYPPTLLSTPLTPTRAGTPHLDGRSRVHVPLVAEQGPTVRTSGVAPEQFLTYVTLELSGFWTQHGGYLLSAAPAPGTTIMMDDGARMLGFSYTDASGSSRRLEVWDDGSMWDRIVGWSAADARVASTTAAVRTDAQVSLSWWETGVDGARLILTRGDGRAPYAYIEVARTPIAPRAAELTADEFGAEHATWASGGEVWLAREQREAPRPCGPTEHCPAPRVHARR